MVMRQVAQRVVPQMIGQGVAVLARHVIEGVFAPKVRAFPAALEREHQARVLSIIEQGLETAVEPVEAAPTPQPKALPQPTAYCPACRMNAAAITMAGYAKGVAEACGGLDGGVPKGYGGTYPLAREAAQEVMKYAAEMGQRQPAMQETMARFSHAVQTLAEGMANVPDCQRAARIAQAADQARTVAHRLTFAYRQAEAKR